MGLPNIIKELLENGVHFGHLSKHWNPRMKRFIFGKKKNIYIIDLEKTAQQLEEAKDFIRRVITDDGFVLFVATKRQLKDTVEQLAVSCQMPYVVERWIGGFLTNFATIQARIKRYIETKEKKERGDFQKTRAKKEILKIGRELEKMERNYRGVVNMDTLPNCLFIVDPKRETAAVREARKLGIPIIALIDTDSDPEIIDYPVPGNDDAIKSVRCIVAYIVEAVKQAQSEKKTKKKEVNAAVSSQQVEDAGEENSAAGADSEEKIQDS